MAYFTGHVIVVHHRRTRKAFHLEIGPISCDTCGSSRKETTCTFYLYTLLLWWWQCYYYRVFSKVGRPRQRRTSFYDNEGGRWWRLVSFEPVLYGRTTCKTLLGHTYNMYTHAEDILWSGITRRAIRKIHT